MYEFCINIGGVRHCFPVPTLIDQKMIKRPPPNNYPPFELAVSVLMLAEVMPASPFSKQLTQAAHAFIQQLQKDLPAGVELVKTQSQHGAGAH